MANTSIFVTGTNTDIGKTFISSMILCAAQAHQFNLHYFKPIQTGTDIDCDTVKKLTNLPDEHIIHPVYYFKLAATPSRAASAENQTINMQHLVDRFNQLPSQSYIVEGAGGLLATITEQHTVRDLVKLLNLPLIIIASTKLGTINHTLLTIEAALAKNIAIKGLILSGEPDPGLAELLQQFSNIPVLAEVPYLETISAQTLQKIAPILFNPILLKRMFT